MADTLKMYDSGGVFFAEKYTMLVYPRGVHSWKFLDDLYPSDSSETALRFIMISPRTKLSLDFSYQIFLKSMPADMEANSAPSGLFRTFFGIEYSTLLPPVPKKDKTADTFFLMYPEPFKAEHDLLTKFFEANQASVYSCFTTGHWNQFATTANTGTVLVNLCYASRATISNPF